jgi:hypothetical protein
MGQGISTALAMVLADKRWSVDPCACHTENSAAVQAATGKRLGYGALVEEAVEACCARDSEAEGSQGLQIRWQALASH